MEQNNNGNGNKDGNKILVLKTKNKEIYKLYYKGIISNYLLKTKT